MSKFEPNLDPEPADATMSVASEDELQIRYDPSFETVLRDDDEDSSVPPPPPPTLSASFRNIRNSIFRGKNNKAKEGDEEEPPPPPPVDIITSQDECESTIELDAAESWMQSLNLKEAARKTTQKKPLIFAIVLFLLALILGLSVGLGGGDDGEKVTTSSDALVDNNAGSTSTDAPEAVTDPPVAVETMSPTTPMNATDAPVEQKCSTSTVTPVDACYEPFQEIILAFENCEPLVNDWIGVWPVASITDPESLPEPLVWLWTCGTQDCEAAVNEDVLFFTEGLSAGTYVALMIRFAEDAAPYTSSYAASSSFEVARKCN